MAIVFVVVAEDEYLNQIVELNNGTYLRLNVYYNKKYFQVIIMVRLYEK